jgi:hypothetical protein
MRWNEADPFSLTLISLSLSGWSNSMKWNDSTLQPNIEWNGSTLKIKKQPNTEQIGPILKKLERIRSTVMALHPKAT